MQMEQVSGALYVHSAPRAVTNHIEWAVNGVLGVPQRYRWTDSPSAETSVRLALHWEGPIGSGVAIASALRGWSDLRFELTEDAGTRSDGMLIMHTPSLGLIACSLDAAGSIVLPESRLAYICQEHAADAQGLVDAIHHALGAQWDQELEPYRNGDPVLAAVRLHAVG